MITKLFEVRDSATFISIVAIKVISENPSELFLLGRAGFSDNSNYVLIASLDGGTNKMSYDPYEWGNRTRKIAHEYIRDNFDSLNTGDVIDVEFILCETQIKKKSERYEKF